MGQLTDGARHTEIALEEFPPSRVSGAAQPGCCPVHGLGLRSPWTKPLVALSNACALLEGSGVAMAWPSSPRGVIPTPVTLRLHLAAFRSLRRVGGWGGDAGQSDRSCGDKRVCGFRAAPPVQAGGRDGRRCPTRRAYSGSASGPSPSSGLARQAQWVPRSLGAGSPAGRAGARRADVAVREWDPLGAWWPSVAKGGAQRLAAHQLLVLLAAGNPTQTGAAPDWRPVSPPS
jgi:hypothetical protein